MSSSQSGGSGTHHAVTVNSVASQTPSSSNPDDKTLRHKPLYIKIKCPDAHRRSSDQAMDPAATGSSTTVFTLINSSETVLDVKKRLVCTGILLSSSVRSNIKGDGCVCSTVSEDITERVVPGECGTTVAESGNSILATSSLNGAQPCHKEKSTDIACEATCGVPPRNDVNKTQQATRDDIKRFDLVFRSKVLNEELKLVDSILETGDEICLKLRTVAS